MNLSRNAPHAHFEDEIKNQALVRMFVVGFMGCYFLFTGHWTHPVYVAFVFYATTVFVLVRVWSLSRCRPLILIPTVLIDNGFSLLGLHVTAEAGYFFFVLQAQIACGFGTRFGNHYLWISVTVSSIGISVLCAIDPYWGKFPHACVAFAIGVPFLAIYFDYLRRRLEMNAMSKMFHAREYSDVLRAFAHDVRAQLQALHALAESLPRSAEDPGSAKSIDGILRITKSIARITSFEILRDHETVEGSISIQGEKELANVKLGSWIGDIVQRFCAPLERSCTTVCIWFESPLPTHCEFAVVSTERALINILSNACRYAKDGELIVSLAWREHTNNTGYVCISVENTVCELSESRSQVEIRKDRNDYFGTGMGQRIASHLLESVGGGATFERTNEGRYAVEMWFPARATYESPMRQPERSTMIFSNRSPDCLELISRNLSSARTVHVRSLTGYEGDVTISNDRANVSMIFDLTSSTDIQRKVSTIANVSGNYCTVYLLQEPVGPERRVGPLIVGVLDDGGASGALETGLSFAETLDPMLHGVEQEPLVDDRLNDVRMLLVDDSVAYCEKLSYVFRSAGAKVDMAHTVESALRLTQAHSYDVLILDWLAGDEIILGFLDRFRESVSPSENPDVYILTGADRTDTEKNLGSHRVRQVLTKPVSMKYLLDTVSNRRPKGATDVQERSNYKDSVVAIARKAKFEELEALGGDKDLLRSLAAKAQIELKGVRRRIIDNWGLGKNRDYHREIHSLIGIADTIGAAELSTLSAHLLGNYTSLKADELTRQLNSIVSAVDMTIDELEAYLGEE